MNKQSREALNLYYQEAGSWAHDKLEMLERSRRLAWWIALAAIFSAVLLVMALIILLPLKTIVPYTLLVDRHTGFVETLKPLDAEKTSVDSALTQSFLVQYVTAREGFDIDAVQNDYRRVSLWSAEPERSQYARHMQASSPDSPLTLYPKSTMIDVVIKSVTSLGPQTSLVRFDTQRRDADGHIEVARAWASVIHYQYSNAPLAQTDRFINPLGFQVLRYHRSSEALGAPEPAVPSSPLQSAPTTTLAPIRAPVTLSPLPQGQSPKPLPTEAGR